MVVNGDTQVYMPGSSRIHETAAEELALALGLQPGGRLRISTSSLPARGSIFLGVADESECVTNLIRAGIVQIHNANSALDAFEVVLHMGVLYLLGSNGRGMLHAVYELQEYLATHRQIKKGLHLSGTFHIPMRIFHQRFSPWPGERADLRFISHMGATHCLVCHDWDLQRNFQQYVVGKQYPNAVDRSDVERNHASLRRIIEHCKDYGLEPCLWITELPCQGGPWLSEEKRLDFFSRYPAEVTSDSGTYQGNVLCFGHPDVQAYYRSLMAEFFKQFPEISMLFLFGMDSGGEFCSPDSCPRCRGLSKFEQRDRFIRFLVEEGRKVRPDLKVLTTSWHWGQGDRHEFLSRQEALPRESGLYMAAQKDGWQVERQCHEFLQQARSICRDNGQTFIGYDDLQWGDDTVHQLGDIQDYPLGIGAKIKRWHELDADGIFDHWGGINEQLSCNAMACREFFLNPLADPDSVAGKIALRQFGAEAGKSVLKAWTDLEKAHRILSNFCVWAPRQWPMWYMGTEHFPDVRGIKSFVACKGMEPLDACKACGITYNAGTVGELYQAVGEAWRLAYPYYARASRSMEKALEMCSDGELFYAWWWNGPQPAVTKTEHIKRQLVYLKANSLVGREIGIHFELTALYLRLSAGGEEIGEERYFKTAKSLLEEDLASCTEIVNYFDAYASEFAPHKEDGFAKGYRNKAAFLKTYLGASQL